MSFLTGQATCQSFGAVVLHTFPLLLPYVMDWGSVCKVPRCSDVATVRFVTITLPMCPEHVAADPMVWDRCSDSRQLDLRNRPAPMTGWPSIEDNVHGHRVESSEFSSRRLDISAVTGFQLPRGLVRPQSVRPVEVPVGALMNWTPRESASFRWNYQDSLESFSQSGHCQVSSKKIKFKSSKNL